MNNIEKSFINLGIDFGTSYTKVCYRFLGIEESGIVTFGGTNVDQAIIPSTVNLDSRSRISIENDSSQKIYKYLKMDLARLEEFDTKLRLEISSVSSWYLAKIINLSRQWIEEKEKERLFKRQPVWSANVGIPVEHYDSPSVKNFEKVFAVAWEWSENRNLPSDLNEIIDCYKQTSQSIAGKVTNCHPVPEITAAIHSFITSREAQLGVYVFFDIGAGSFDGVSFNYHMQQGSGSINCYAGKVIELGVEVLKLSDRGRCLKCLQDCVGEVICAITEKDPAGFIRDQSILPVFVGGGGANIEWYPNSITFTYEDYQHKNARLPPYELREVPKPSDLEMHELNNSDFNRFSVAYGLSIPYGTLMETRLPKSVEPAQREEQPSGIIIPSGVANYPDKESYDFPRG